MNGRQQDLQLVSHALLVSLASQEVQTFLAPGMNGTQSTIEFAINALLDTHAQTKLQQHYAQLVNIQTLEIIFAETVPLDSIVQPFLLCRLLAQWDNFRISLDRLLVKIVQQANLTQK